MQDTRTTIKKLIQLGALAYLLVAVLYTTAYLLAYPLSSLSPKFNLDRAGFDHGSSQRRSLHPRVDLIGQTLQSSGSSDNGENNAFLTSFLASDDLLYWQDAETGDYASSPVREETFLSKAFSQAMHPTKIIPFFYKATGPIDEGDVTITTLVTSNRFPVLKKLVERYEGPISVTIHIPLSASAFGSGPAQRQFVSAVQNLEALYASSPHFATYVDVHLALSPFSGTTSAHKDSGTSEGGRQFNVWRNAARLFARTEFVMMLDVDFALCTDWRSAIREATTRFSGDVPNVSLESFSGPSFRNDSINKEMFDMLRAGMAALVIPAFEYVKEEDGNDQVTFPRDKESLVRLTSTKTPKIASFHSSWAPGHNSTDYPKYLSIPPGSGEIYKVTTYQSAYEPYVITSKRVSWCDERFTGYGGNKAACLFEMYLSGVSFYVMSDHFLVHQSHKYEEEARREERKYNRKLYAGFKEEACLRYLYKFHVEGALHTPLASNALEECRKLKSVVKLATELLGHDITNIAI